MPQLDITHFGGNEVPSADFDSAQIVVLPLCYESAPSYGKGSQHGPKHILNASVQLERIEEETLFDWGALKIHTLPAVVPKGLPREAVSQMMRSAERVIQKGKYLLSLGGDHAASIGPAQAAAWMYPDLGVLQIDAHMDMRDEWNGSPYNHACVMRRISDTTDIRTIVQVGIRAFSKEEYEATQENTFKTLFAHDIDPADDAWMDRVVKALPEKVYLTVDLDGLDPGVMPGTGTPEPGGLSYRQLINLIRKVGQKRHVIAADVMELAKIEGFQVSEYTAAKIATKILVHCFRKPISNAV